MQFRLMSTSVLRIFKIRISYIDLVVGLDGTGEIVGRFRLGVILNEISVLPVNRLAAVSPETFMS